MENPVVQLKKTPFLQGNTDILHRKQEVLSENSIMYRKSGYIVKKKTVL